MKINEFLELVGMGLLVTFWIFAAWAAYRLIPIMLGHFAGRLVKSFRKALQ